MPKGVKTSLAKAVVNHNKKLQKQHFFLKKDTLQTAYKSGGNCLVTQLSDTYINYK